MEIYACFVLTGERQLMPSFVLNCQVTDLCLPSSTRVNEFADLLNGSRVPAHPFVIGELAAG